MHKANTGQGSIDEITNSVETWLDTMPINLDPKDKTAVIKDLAHDILDRKEYLKENTGDRTTHQDELANMKYHVFRRLSKVTDSENLAPFMQGTEELLEKINPTEVSQEPPKLQLSERKGWVVGK